ncbi:hypothetical protein [Nocardioides sp. T2.26MG-1]|uniref:hypothetical protein n=1 Tax=Nocardioides sp. T2.26MG-1 TaxID=3041166 RepID=UPI0024774060|nr:hypothetical protein [Nocardioides sp. T2.26MG-1]CAI9404001.1 hypothetical protein HIDPHFAB_04092 [Nocardioides sp. T2.26MG-1]
MLYLVKVRVDVTKLAEFGAKIANQEFDNSSTRWTYCRKDDPAVGYSLWETTDEAEFVKKFSPYRPYYAEVEVTEMVLPSEAQALLMDGAQRQ